MSCGALSINVCVRVFVCMCTRRGAGLRAASPEELLKRWVEFRVNKGGRRKQGGEGGKSKADGSQAAAAAAVPARPTVASWNQKHLLNMLASVAQALEPFDPKEVGSASTFERCDPSISLSSSKHVSPPEGSLGVSRPRAPRPPALALALAPSAARTSPASSGDPHTSTLPISPQAAAGRPSVLTSSYDEAGAGGGDPRTGGREEGLVYHESHRRESHQDYLASLDAASGLLAALVHAGFPGLDLTATQLTDTNQDLARLLYAAHIFLHQPDMRPQMLDALRLQTQHLGASFRALAAKKSLYVEGLHPVN
jgi:hypothetical protein